MKKRFLFLLFIIIAGTSLWAENIRGVFAGELYPADDYLSSETVSFYLEDLVFINWPEVSALDEAIQLEITVPSSLKTI